MIPLHSFREPSILETALRCRELDMLTFVGLCHLKERNIRGSSTYAH